MGLSINLTEAEEERLSELAEQQGLTPSEYAETRLREHLAVESLTKESMVFAKLRQWQKETRTKTYPHESTKELFARWNEEDLLLTDEERDAERILFEDLEKVFGPNPADFE